jgi:membrane fusion protein (multidrug efflux system)
LAQAHDSDRFPPLARLLLDGRAIGWKVKDVRMRFDVSTTTLLAVVTAASLGVACEQAPAAAPPPPEVYVTNVVQQDVPVYLDLVGQTAGFQDVEIRARVEGFLETVNFREGSFVRRGDLLYEIDRQPLEALLAAAKADQGTAEAALAKASNDVARYTPLVPKQAVSRQELDNALAARDAARSQVEAAKAAVEKATLDLGYARVTSPIAGLIGTTEVNPGNLVGRGESTLLTTISQIDPLIFRVGVTEADYLRIARRLQTQPGDAARSAEGIVLTLADGTVYPHTGRVNAVERAVDPTTGTLALDLLFPNPELVLRPGQYGRARLLLETRSGLLLVPQRAVQELQNLHSVAVVDGAGKVAFRSVKVGPRVDSLWVIEEGLGLGDRVVVEGLQRIQDGMMVDAKPAPAPAGGAGTATSGAN